MLEMNLTMLTWCSHGVFLSTSSVVSTPMWDLGTWNIPRLMRKSVSLATLSTITRLPDYPSSWNSSDTSLVDPIWSASQSCQWWRTSQLTSRPVVNSTTSLRTYGAGHSMMCTQPVSKSTALCFHPTCQSRLVMLSVCSHTVCTCTSSTTTNCSTQWCACQSPIPTFSVRIRLSSRQTRSSSKGARCNLLS